MSQILTPVDINNIIHESKNVEGSAMLPYSFAQEVEAAVLAKLAQQEPVAYMRPSDEGYDSAFRDTYTVAICTGGDWSAWFPLYAAPHPAPEFWNDYRACVGGRAPATEWETQSPDLQAELAYANKTLAAIANEKLALADQLAAVTKQRDELLAALGQYKQNLVPWGAVEIAIKGATA